MVYSPQASSGQHPLDEIQTHSATIGYGWQSGLDASLTTSTSSIESQWTAGSILWDRETIDIPSGTITHDAGDATNPRWDALVVSDSSGTVQAVKGTPAPVATDDAGTEYRGEQAWTPSPSDQITRDMVVFAMVWIPAGAANNDDLTNTTAGGVAEPVVDRRVEAPAQLVTKDYIHRMGSLSFDRNQVPAGSRHEDIIQVPAALSTVHFLRLGISDLSGSLPANVNLDIKDHNGLQSYRLSSEKELGTFETPIHTVNTSNFVRVEMNNTSDSSHQLIGEAHYILEE